jgi:hypothetical protein
MPRKIIPLSSGKLINENKDRQLSLSQFIIKETDLKETTENLVKKYCKLAGIKELPIVYDKKGQRLADLRSHTDIKGEVHPAIHINYKHLKEIYEIDPEKAEKFLEYGIAHEVAHGKQLEQYGLMKFARTPRFIIEDEAEEMAYALLGYPSEDVGKKEIDKITEFFRKELKKKYGIKEEPKPTLESPRYKIKGKVAVRIVGWENPRDPNKAVISTRSITEDNWERLVPKRAKKVWIIEFDERGNPIPKSDKFIPREELKNYYVVT